MIRFNTWLQRLKLMVRVWQSWYHIWLHTDCSRSTSQLTACFNQVDYSNCHTFSAECTICCGWDNLAWNGYSCFQKEVYRWKWNVLCGHRRDLVKKDLLFNLSNLFFHRTLEFMNPLNINQAVPFALIAVLAIVNSCKMSRIYKSFTDKMSLLLFLNSSKEVSKSISIQNWQCHVRLISTAK